jgi:hypothetical protein
LENSDKNIVDEGTVDTLLQLLSVAELVVQVIGLSLTSF